MSAQGDAPPGTAGVAVSCGSQGKGCVIFGFEHLVRSRFFRRVISLRVMERPFLLALQFVLEFRSLQTL